jgi:hypothetical protein
MAASLLKYANREKVAQALTAQGYSVTRMTVNRWARGDEMPEIAARMIASLFSHEAGTQKEPPPDWGRLMERVEDIALAVDARRPEERQEDAAERLMRRHAADAEQQTQDAAEGSDGRDVPAPAPPPRTAPGGR